MKSSVILVDIHYLHFAETGIRKAMEEFIDLVEQNKDANHKYIFTPSVSKVKNFRRRRSILFRLLHHLEILLWKQLYIPIKSYLVKADIVFFWDYYAPLWSLRARKAVMFHDTFYWDSPEHYGRFWLPYFKMMSMNGVKRNGSILTITHSAKRKISNLFPYPVDIKVIPHPHRQMSIKTTDSSKILESFKLVKQNYFLHVGVFEKRKNLLTLISGFKKFLEKDANHGHKLVLVGNPALNSKLDDSVAVQDLISQLGLEDNVVLTGYISDGDVACLYENADAYIFPSKNEGFGIPILEAFEMGCPVIISRQEALVEVAGDAALGFDTESDTSLSETMCRISQDRELRLDLVRKGKERLKDFDRNVYFDDMEKYFGILIK